VRGRSRYPDNRMVRRGTDVMPERFTETLRAASDVGWSHAVQHRFVYELFAGAVPDAVMARYLVIVDRLIALQLIPLVRQHGSPRSWLIGTIVRIHLGILWEIAPSSFRVTYRLFVQWWPWATPPWPSGGAMRMFCIMP